MAKVNEKINELFGQDLVVVNVGLKSFYDTLKGKGYKAVHVNWRPPAGGNKKLISILSKLKKK